MHPVRHLVALLALSLIACAPEYPEVIVVNEIEDDVLIRSISFNGCQWDAVLALGDATSPQFCLPGEDRVHFQKFDAGEYCHRQVEDSNIPDLCYCDESARPAEDPFDQGIIDREPVWFNYQTISVKHVQEGSFHRFILSADDLEQDFTVPGPYGH